MKKRTLLAPVVASAVILAGLGFVPTTAEAVINWNLDGTANVGYSGDVNDVSKYIGVQTSVDKSNHKVTWVVTFNKPKAYWSGQILHVFLPADVDSKTVVIQRKYGNGTSWTDQATIKDETSTAGASRYDKDPKSTKWINDWNGRFYERAEGQPVSAEDLAELKGWYDSGKFGAHFYSQEGPGSPMFVWTITANYKEGTDPYSMPLVFVEQAWNGSYTYALLQGPHNTDKHNFNDVAENAWGIDPAVVDTITQYVTPVLHDEQKVAVDNPSSLTETEKEALIGAAKQAVRNGITGSSRTQLQQNTIINESTFELKDDGTILVTYPDNSGEAASTDVINISDLISRNDKSAAPTVNPVHTQSGTVSGAGVPGSKITVTLPNGTVLSTLVKDNGTWSVDLPSTLSEGDKVSVRQFVDTKLPSDPIEKTVTKSIAESNPVNPPATKTYVDDASSLSDDEKDAVEQAVRDANPSEPTNSADIKVEDDGTVVITYSDGSTNEIKPDATVEQKQQAPAPTLDEAHAGDTSLSGTGEPGYTIKVKIGDGEPVETTVLPDGTWKIEGINPALKPNDKLSVAQVSDKTLANTIEASVKAKAPTDKVPVDDASNLTNEEKEAVEDAIRDANPDLPADTNITVDDDGTAHVVYPGGGEDIIPAENTVSQKPASDTPTVDHLDSDDTIISGTAKAGATVTVTLPDGTKLDTTAGDDGKWSVDIPADKDLTHGQTVTVQARDDADHAPTSVTANVDKTDAEKASEAGIETPADKIPVDDASHLTDEEKQQVKDAIIGANEGLEPAIDHVDVADDGTATLVFPDGSKVEIPGSDLVSQKDPSAAPTVNPVSSASTEISGTGVSGSEIVVTLPDGTKLTTTVGDDGNWSVPVPSPSPLTTGSTFTVSQREPGKAPAAQTVTVNPSQAESTNVKLPDAKVEVDDPSKLTDEDKAKVEDAIAKANPNLPEGTKIEAGTNGVTITFPDGSTKTIPYSDLVVKKGAADKHVRPASGTGRDGLANTGDPATGAAAATGLAGAFASMAAALLRKRRN